MSAKFAALIIVFAASIIALSAEVNTGRKVVVGRAVAANQQVSMDQIVDHALWHQLLQKYVNEQGEVNYKAWNASAEDGQALDTYLNTLSTASTTTAATKPAQFAFWINAYNAVTIKGILREYPTSSIRNHTPRLAGYNIWNDLLLEVGSIQISLNDMEHEVLRKMGDPRIHFAIVCASHSCPRLLNQAYTGEQLEEQLVLNTQDFFANQGNFQYDPNQGQFKLSSIMDWFKDDFGDGQAAQLTTIAPYLPTREAYDAALANSVSVSYLEYDWSLNEQPDVLEREEARPAASGSGRR